MKFRLLGPLEVVVDGARLPVRAGKQRVVLASLLIDANRVVPVDELMAKVWDDVREPPGLRRHERGHAAR